MTDDLVKRLRLPTEHEAWLFSVPYQAADRIEALEEALIGISCDCNDGCYYDHVFAYCPHQLARAALREKKDD